MIEKIRDWFGFGAQAFAGHGHDGGSHGHTHGVVDPTIATTDRGIWAIKWSFVILAITAVLQLLVVFTSGSVALLADTIHNVGDATTAIPLWIAFVLARRKPSATFTYGYGRAEDLAGILIVLIILFSAIVAGYEAIDRLIHPQPVTQLLWVTLAGIVGFIGNEAVAVFRIKVGREIDSAALIADGYHARTDGLTSLAVVLGALGVWLGFPLADPIVGLLITIAIFGIVWQSARAVLTRMLDGVEPGITEEIRHAAEHVPGILKVLDAKARWLGHRMHADIAIDVPKAASLTAANAIAGRLRGELLAHMPALRSANITFGLPEDGLAGDEVPATGHGRGHHHALEPITVQGGFARGVLEIVATPDGERMQFTAAALPQDAELSVVIDRPEGEEVLAFRSQPEDPSRYMSLEAPAEPHEFVASLVVRSGGREETLPFRMTEPTGHAH